MTYPAQTQTIDQIEHEFRSIRRWLNQFEIFTGRDIWLERPPIDFSRPALNIRHIDSNEEDQGRSLVKQLNDWQIEVLVEDNFWQAQREVSAIRQRLLQSYLIPLYLWGWQPPPIEVEGIAGGGSLTAGEVSVVVTAVNDDDEESLATDSATVTVASGSSIRIAIVPWPRAASVAKEYRVYAGAVGAETLEATVLRPTSPVNIFHTLTALAGGGAEPPTTSVFFSHFLRVSDVTSRVLQHPAIDTVFNGIISFRTSNQLSRIATPGAAAKEPIQTVTTDLEVS